MARYALTCLDCGGPHEVGRRDAKRCPSCRLLGYLEWAVGKFKRARRCRACGKLYKPFRPLNRDVATCGHCMERNDRRDPVLRCGLCQRATAGTDGVAVCLACTKDPDLQPTVIKALRKGQRERRAKHSEAYARVKAAKAPELRPLN
jgi:hypothetical protein